MREAMFALALPEFGTSGETLSRNWVLSKGSVRIRHSIMPPLRLITGPLDGHCKLIPQPR